MEMKIEKVFLRVKAFSSTVFGCDMKTFAIQNFPATINESIESMLHIIKRYTTIESFIPVSGKLLFSI